MVNATCCGCAQYIKIEDLLRLSHKIRFFKYVGDIKLLEDPLNVQIFIDLTCNSTFIQVQQKPVL